MRPFTALDSAVIWNLDHLYKISMQSLTNLDVVAIDTSALNAQLLSLQMYMFLIHVITYLIFTILLVENRSKKSQIHSYLCFRLITLKCRSHPICSFWYIRVLDEGSGSLVSYLPITVILERYAEAGPEILLIRTGVPSLGQNLT